MEEFTKNNPGCYHQLLEYLSKISGIPLKKEIVFNSVRDMVEKNKNGKTVLKYNRRDIWVEKNGNRYWMPIKKQRKGGLYEIEMQDGTTFPIGTEWDRVGVYITRQQKEFGIEIIPSGKYQDSLGGGWSQSVALYRINDKYFADMDCAH